MIPNPASFLTKDLLPQLLKKEADQFRWLWTAATSEVLRRREEKFCHFVRLAEVDIAEIRKEIDATPEERWLLDNGRKRIEVQRETDSIVLRNVEFAKGIHLDPTIKKSIHIHEVADTRIASRYPYIMKFLNDFAAEMESSLSRAMIVRLSSKNQVYPHFDAGYYYLVRDRYHLVIKSPLGSKMRCMDDVSLWKEGELWWFNNKVEHEAFNNADEWRVHLIFDLLPHQLAPMVEQIKRVTPYYQAQELSAEASRSDSHTASNEQTSGDAVDVEQIAETREPNAIVNKLAGHSKGSIPARSVDEVPLLVKEVQAGSVGDSPAIDSERLLSPTLASIAESIQGQCIVTADTELLTSPAGTKQSWLIDLRVLFSQASALEALTGHFFYMLGSRDVLQIAGMETASIPLLTAICLEGRRRGKEVASAIIRKERKHTGRGRNIEGKLGNEPVILIDDVLNSGGSAERARVALQQAGARIESVFVVVDYQSSKGMEWRRRNNIKVHSLFTLSDFGLTLAKSSRPSLNRNYRLLWGFQPEGGSPFHVVPKSAPLLVHDRLYFGTDKGSFWSIDARNGQPIWEFKAKVNHPKGIWSSPAHHDGRIYFGTYNGNVHCLDAKTGVEVWCQSACEWVGSSPLILPQYNTLIVGLEYARKHRGGSVCAMSLDSGAKVWERWLDVVQHGSCSYWRGGDLVISGTNDHNVVAMKAGTGETVWTFNTRRSVKYAPAIDEQRRLVAFASFDGSIYILKCDSGEKVAEFKTDNICYTTPLFANGRLFCGSGDRHFYVIDLDTMTLALKLDCRARVYSSPRLMGDNVIFGTGGGVVYEMNSSTLDIVGKVVVPDSVSNAISFTGDSKRIFVPTSMNEIYCYERS